MNHIVSTLTFVLFMLTASCQNLPTVTTVFKPQLEEHTSETQTLVSFMEERCQKMNFKNASIEVDDKTGLLTLVAPVDLESKTDLERYRALFKSNSLELWNTYRISDPEIQEILTLIPQIDGFSDTRKLIPGSFPLEILGFCNDETKLEAIIDTLKPLFSELPDLKMLWSVDNGDSFTGEQGYKLYLIKTKGKAEAPINDTHITEVEASVSNYSGMPEILFSLDKEGTEIWAGLTRKAAMNDNRSIAIVINDRVYSVPRVMSEITAGRCAISGAFSLLEADEIASAIALGRLPFPIEILEEKINAND